MRGKNRFSQIEVENICIEIEKKKIKNMYLRVYPPDGRVKISAPFKVTDKEAGLFALSKLNWIKEQQLKIQQKETQPKVEQEYISGEIHYLWGIKYLLNIIPVCGRPRIEIRDRCYLDLYIGKNSEKKDRQKVLTEFYRQELKAQIPRLIEKWQEIIGVKPNAWAVKNMKTKWGACNISARRIWLNLQLAKKSPHCLEYVVVHEIVHLLVKYHDRRFKSYMDKYLPPWRGIEEELNK